MQTKEEKASQLAYKQAFIDQGYTPGTTGLNLEQMIGGKRLWWASLCSMHANYNPTCHMCVEGEWAKVADRDDE